MQLKSNIALLCSITVIFSCSHITDTNDLLENEHFDFVLYDGLNSSDITGISKELDANYERIIDDLQVQNMPRVTIKIWSDYNNFLNNMENDIGTRYPGATGYVFLMKEIRIFYNSQVALTAVHEFAHLVSIQVNSTILNNPRWLWEAVALYESQDFINPKTLTYMVSGDYPTLSELSTDYNSSNHSIYSVGYVLLEYIVLTWGMDAVIELIKNNGNLFNSLGLSTQEFELGWYHFVEEKYLN